jgi:hypothetical protein
MRKFLGYDTVMKKRYYDVHDVIKTLARQGVVIDIADLHSCTREQIIHPLIYIDSVPVHACESHKNEAVAVGFCFLSAYCDVGDEIIAIFDRLLREPSFKTSLLVKKENLIDFRIFSWNTEPYLFADVPHGHSSPKPFSGEEKISYFMFLKNNPFYVRIENLVISQKDLQILAQYYIAPNQEKLSSTTANSKIRKKDEAAIPNHHSKKRTQILRAAVAVVHSYRSNIETGASIFKFIEGDKHYLFENKTIPLSGNVCIELINAYIKPLEYCNFNHESRSLSDQEKIWSAVLSIIHNNINIDDEAATIEEIKNCLNQNKKKLDLSDNSILNSFDEELRSALKLLI